MNGKYKINLHLLEGCNYHCRHCFAHFGSHRMLSLDQWERIIDNCIREFPVSEFNLAGGEPMLYPDLLSLAKHIKARGKNVSLITNGSCMDSAWIRENAALWTTIGFSVDSFIDGKAKIMGRIDQNGNCFTHERLKNCCQEIKTYNPECRIKLNTVVSALNKDETFYDFPDFISKWKIIRMKLYESDKFSNRDLLITDREFQIFAERNLQMLTGKTRSLPAEDSLCSKIIRVNPGQMVVIEYTTSASYLIVDANGCLLDNHSENVYRPVCNLLVEDFADGLKKLHFERERYWSRYEVQTDCGES